MEFKQKAGLNCCLVGNPLGKQLFLKHYESIEQNLLVTKDDYAMKKFVTRSDQNEVSVKLHQLKGSEDRNVISTKQMF
mgnify:CR=1 FL=1